MGILLFANSGKEIEEKLVDLINAFPQKHTIEICHSIFELSERFHQPRQDVVTMVFLVGSREDILSLLLLKKLFFDIPLILILPDREKETARLGFKMIPPFVSYEDGNFEEIQSVMTNMLKQYDLRFGNNKHMVTT